MRREQIVWQPSKTPERGQAAERKESPVEMMIATQDIVHANGTCEQSSFADVEPEGSPVLAQEQLFPRRLQQDCRAHILPMDVECVRVIRRYFLERHAHHARVVTRMPEQRRVRGRNVRILRKTATPMARRWARRSGSIPLDHRANSPREARRWRDSQDCDAGLPRRSRQARVARQAAID